MATTVELVINNIKNIKNCTFEASLDKGIYAIVGTNGCGKSTLMSALATLVRPRATDILRQFDYDTDSYIKIRIGDTVDTIKPNGTRWETSEKINNRSYMKNNYEGFYEGSIFYGTRFYDYALMDELLERIDKDSDLRDVDSFVKENLSYILHGDKLHYTTLKKIKTKKHAQSFNLKGMPYFFTKDDKLISQYSMSSGECMLISLIDFVHNLFHLSKKQNRERVLFFIDEVELALHPAAIDRLILFFNNHIKSSAFDIAVFFSTHSSEVVQKIEPRNIYLLENNDGTIDIINPCYANYAIRNLYVPNGFDFLILVEDELAKALVDRIIKKSNIHKSKLVCIVPGGGWSQLLKLHSDISTYNVLGIGKKVISVYDGDVKNEVQSKDNYKHLPKTFLPIGSIEKYLKQKLYTNKDRIFCKLIGDKYFTQQSVESIVKEYTSTDTIKYDTSGKKLYKLLLQALMLNGIPEDQFIYNLCTDIEGYEAESIQIFEQSLKQLLE